MLQGNPLHKLLCLQFKDAIAQTSGAPMTRAILFLDTLDIPRFEWVLIDWITKGYLDNTADGALGEGEIEICIYQQN